MKKVIAVSAFAVLAACGEPAPEVPAGPPVEVTAVDLAAAYEANEVAAQQQYGDKPLLVSGTIEGIQLDLFDKPFLTLHAGEMSLGANANLTEASQAKAGSLSKGQQITLLCSGVSEVIGSPQLDECEIQ